MDAEIFKRELGELGFTEVLTRVWPANQFVDTHTHDFEVRALVLEGEFVLGCDGKEQAAARRRHLHARCAPPAHRALRAAGRDISRGP